MSTDTIVPRLLNVLPTTLHMNLRSTPQEEIYVWYRKIGQKLMAGYPTDSSGELTKSYLAKLT